MMRPRCSDTYNIVLYYIPTCYIYLHRHSYTTMTLLLSCIATVSPTIYRVHSSAYNGSMVLLNTCWCCLPSYICFLFIFSAPSSPVHNRRLLSTRTIRMSSVELPDDNDKSLSSASTSPCPSPVRYSQVQYYNNYTRAYIILW